MIFVCKLRYCMLSNEHKFYMQLASLFYASKILYQAISLYFKVVLYLMSSICYVQMYVNIFILLMNSVVSAAILLSSGYCLVQE